jgi:hypothetical protein
VSDPIQVITLADQHRRGTAPAAGETQRPGRLCVAQGVLSCSPSAPPEVVHAEALLQWATFRSQFVSSR